MMPLRPLWRYAFGMVVEDRVGLPPEELAALEGELAAVATLHELILWGLRRDLIVSDVVVQDEYTHDVVLPYRGDLHLVFDST
jgi:hypothetical protein